MCRRVATRAGWPGKIRKLHRDAREAGAVPAWAGRPLRELHEDFPDRYCRLLCRHRQSAFDYGQGIVALPLKNRPDQLILAGKVIIQCLLGYFGRRGNGVNADAGKPLSIEAAVGLSKEAFAGGIAVTGSCLMYTHE